MSNIQFDTPANRVIAQSQPKNRFRIDTSLPDLPFLRQLSVQGRLRFFQSTNLEDTPITITPPTGETFFFYRASFSNSSTTTSLVTIVNDGQQRFGLRLLTAANGAGQVTTEFIDSLVGDETKSFVVDATDAASVIECSVFGWVENTSRIRDVTS